MPEPILRIAVAVPLRRLFDYLPPADAAPQMSWHPGLRLAVPFGMRRLPGVLVETLSASEVPKQRLKRAHAVLDTEPVLPPDILELCRRCAEYYQYAPGEVLHTALPALLRRLPGKTARSGLGAPLEPLAPPPEPGTDAPLVLRPEQRRAVREVRGAFGSFTPFLLSGVTGSGKTEVYLRLVEESVKMGRQALVLTPEIGLTPQLLGPFQRRLGKPVAVLHSGLSDRQRLQNWRAAGSGEARVLIGTRSAVFAPLAAPGLFIVDEEHDRSYKQQDRLRYSARDLAVMRAQQCGTPVVLGSATPSLESLHNVHGGRYRQLQLQERSGVVAEHRLVDIRGLEMQGGICTPLLDALDTELEAGNQALIFINRRGYAPVLQCRDCGRTVECPHCDARLVVHARPRRLSCHHCDAETALPAECPGCGSPHLLPSGYGTQRSEQFLQQRFPGVPVYRVDRDSVARGRNFPGLLEKIHSGAPCILVGTQMLTKGHHFPDLTLAAILDADSGLLSADFRAAERFGQMLVQVGGRAGRWRKPGTVWIQSRFPEHPLFELLFSNGYEAFVDALLAERRQRMLPPFCYMALLRAEGEEAPAVERWLKLQRRALEQGAPPGMQLIGPLTASPAKRAGRHRLFLSIYAERRPRLQALLTRLCERLERSRAPRGLRWSLDVDPQEPL